MGFCVKCGKETVEGQPCACGQDTAVEWVQEAPQQAAAEAAPVAESAPVAVAAAPEGVGSSVDVKAMANTGLGLVKAFFSKEPLAVLDNAMASTGKDWVILAALLVAANGLMLAVGWGRAGAWLSFMNGSMFGLGLVAGLLGGAVRFAAAALAAFAFLKVVKKPAGFAQVANMAAVALLPVAVTYAAGFVLNFFAMGLTDTVTSIAVLMSQFLLVYGVVKMGTLELKKSVWQLVIFMAVYSWVMNLLTGLVYGIFLGASVLGSLGSLSGLLG